jgi:hypothetical protein
MNRVAVIVSVILLPSLALAAPAFAPGKYPLLDKKMLNHTRYFYEISARPFGLGVSTGYKDQDGLDAILAFLAQDETDDFEQATGIHPYSILSQYEGASGVGLRGGGAAPATAFRYMALKAEGAPEDVLAPARRDVERAIESILIAHTITGVPGVIARGIARLTSDEETGPRDIPVKQPVYVPLKDEEGNPLPEPKNNGVDRADNSGGALPEGMWFWQDSCSKDQLVGWVAAMVTLYDAAKDDPAVDQNLVLQLEEVARLIGASLRQTHEMDAVDGETYEYDLVIMDADGRPSQHWDLNPLSIDRALTLPPDYESLNIFNLVMALGIVKGLYHVSGDPEAEAFLYGELLGNRAYLDHLDPEKDMDYTYGGAYTNFSNVNMMLLALFLNLWTENDPAAAQPIRDYMESSWWDVPGLIQTAKNCKQPYYEALYLAMTDRGFDQARADETVDLLMAFQLEPYQGMHRNNCDDDEIAALQCLAIDGETILNIQHVGGKPSKGWGDYYVALTALDPAIRPTSTFDARSNPFKVNTTDGSDLSGPSMSLNPGGDLNTAYWLLRWMPNPGTGMYSHLARNHMPLPNGEEPEPIPDAQEVFPDVIEPDASQAQDDLPGAPDAPPVPDAVADEDVPGIIAPGDVVVNGDTATGGDNGGPVVKASGGCSAQGPSTTNPAIFLILLAPLALIAGRRQQA